MSLNNNNNNLIPNFQIKMSAFPRRVPKAVVKENVNLRRAFVGVLTASPLVVGGVGEYLGWWKKLDLPEPGTPERMLFDTQNNDIRTMRQWIGSVPSLSRTVSMIQETEKKLFQMDMSIGVKKFILDENAAKNEEGVEVDSLIFTQAPPKLKGDSLIVVTSSKKSDTEKQDGGQPDGGLKNGGKTAES
ncbi:uncharacterized protein LOC111713820 [Eurytemora carolleeae]|uniref:uncharacterized protein LOC111713820 n=1 Tax=Eurytemora carolleeae TaxID=1294199 RepID=UPI000C76836B|nr:uncharacterized protein LOC111713820 [Eurytemora carolleeae]XP_023344536.1 uncharacterized protein LOC111713820 [Eurytemora carolleeae]XP_023344537.1 uncharacterized protein LOC111713820 [Eurytemora carolleeae]|eukprot:XP_023344535.1 uncharacterized protein LOC111713820 [Eurytemora affinis]